MANDEMKVHGNQQGEKSIPYAEWLRATATIMILFCHFCSQKEGAIFTAAGQVLNIGVPLFFILSGYLFGRKGVHAPYNKWFLRRLQRLWIPYWLFVAVLATVYLIKGYSIFTLDWLLLLFGLQGSNVGVWGAEQTWFISPLLICYGLTPLISLAAKKLPKNNIPYFLICVCLFPVLLLVMRPAAIGTLLAPVCLYTVAYFVGNRALTVKLSNSGACFAAFVVVLSFGVRFILRIFFDGTIFYSGIVATYTHYLAAFAIFYLFAWFFQERKPAGIISFISKISFEIYLYHYMFTVGPISLFSATPFWGINCILVICATFLIATAMQYVGKILNKKLFSEVRRVV